MGCHSSFEPTRSLLARLERIARDSCGRVASCVLSAVYGDGAADGHSRRTVRVWPSVRVFAQCVMDGFQRFAGGKLITVFSATNYCNRWANAGAILLIGKDLEIVPKMICERTRPHPPPFRAYAVECCARPRPA